MLVEACGAVASGGDSLDDSVMRGHGGQEGVANTGECVDSNLKVLRFQIVTVTGKALDLLFSEFFEVFSWYAVLQ